MKHTGMSANYEPSYEQRTVTQQQQKEEFRATPYNTPIPMHTVQRSATQQDPTATLFASGGSLTLNASDREGLNAWFQNSFKNQFKYQSTWFRAEWFPEFFAPMRDVINANFKKAFAQIGGVRDELQKEQKDLIARDKKLFEILEILSLLVKGKGNEFIAGRLDQITREFKGLARKQALKTSVKTADDFEDEDDCVAQLTDDGMDEDEAVAVCENIFAGERASAKTIEPQQPSR